MLKNVFHGPAPSIQAASSSSFGNPLKNCENMTEFNISQAHIDKICRNIKTPSKRMLAIKLFNTYIEYIIYKGVGGGQDQFLDIRTIKYLLGILKV